MCVFSRSLIDYFSSQTGTWRFNSNGVGSLNNTIDSIDGSDEFVASLANSPIHPSEEARNRLVRPKSLLERARMNVA